MTPAEVALLRSLAEADVGTFMPENNTAAAVARFEVTVASVPDLHKAGCVALEVGGSGVQTSVRTSSDHPAHF